MPWYYCGFLLAISPTYFLLDTCLLCQFTGFEPLYTFLNYAIGGIILNLGWAMCQVSHMSLVPSLSFSRSRRDMLSNLRGTFTFIANLCALVFAAVIFAVLDNDRLKFNVLSLCCMGLGLLCSLIFIYNIRERPLTAACRTLRSAYIAKLAKFRREGVEVRDDDAVLHDFATEDLKDNDTESWKSFEGTSVGKGVVDAVPQNNKMYYLISHLFIYYPLWTYDSESMTRSNAAESVAPTYANGNNKSKITKFQWYHWLQSLQFWLYGVVYMSARVYCNISIVTFLAFLHLINKIVQNFLLLYLTYSLQFAGASEHVETSFSFALIPMMTFISSSLIATQLSKCYRLIGR